jgi:hypothetical protein
MTDEINLRAASERIESLIGELSSVDDPSTRQKAEQLIRLVTEMYGAGFARILQILKQDEAFESAIDSLCKDGLVASLFGLHGLQPAQAHRSARCELCGNGISESHRHIAEVDTRKLLCSCRACSFLFDGNRGVRAKYRAVPQRYVDLAESAITAAEWEELQIPVGVVFFFFNSALNRMVACYPGPAGATESLLPLECWNSIVRAHPVLDSLVADVEAIFVDNRRERESPLSYLIPIDACYEIVARLRSHWKGFDGGNEARREINAFFAELRSRSQPVAPSL